LILPRFERDVPENRQSKPAGRQRRRLLPGPSRKAAAKSASLVPLFALTLSRSARSQWTLPMWFFFGADNPDIYSPALHHQAYQDGGLSRGWSLLHSFCQRRRGWKKRN